MEYGEAIFPAALYRAVSLARDLVEKGSRTIESAASEAVARVYCVCVTDGEDAAEGRLSGVHRRLIESVIRGLRAEPERALPERS